MNSEILCKRSAISIAAMVAAATLISGTAFAGPITFTVTGQESGTFTFDGNPPTYVGSDGELNFYKLISATGYFSGATAASPYFVPADRDPAVAGVQSLGSYVTAASWNFSVFSDNLPVNSDGTFNVGTYSAFDQRSGASVTMTVSGGGAPSAPAPMIGGGFIAALAALVGLVWARMGRRSPLSA